MSTIGPSHATIRRLPDKVDIPEIHKDDGEGKVNTANLVTLAEQDLQALSFVSSAPTRSEQDQSRYLDKANNQVKPHPGEAEEKGPRREGYARSTVTSICTTPSEVRSFSPGTFGVKSRISTPFSRLPAPHDFTPPETDYEASTALSELDDSISEHAPDVEHYEQNPIMAPKVGGFGVKTGKVRPHEDEMRRIASERATKVSGRHEKELNSRPALIQDKSWGSNFWCIIEQPKGRSFFANPQTGECAWAVPSGTFVLPLQSEGQWWELFDEKAKLSYYYHTKSKVSQWDRPKGFVIPLAAIQESTLGRRFSKQFDKKLRDVVYSAGMRVKEKSTNPKQAPTQGNVPAWNEQIRPEGHKDESSVLHAVTQDSWQSPRSRCSRSKPPPLPFLTGRVHMHHFRRYRSGTELLTIASQVEYEEDERPKLRTRSKSGTLESRTESEEARIQNQSVDFIPLASCEYPRPYRREGGPDKRRLLREYPEVFEQNDIMPVSYTQEQRTPPLTERRSRALAKSVPNLLSLLTKCMHDAKAVTSPTAPSKVVTSAGRNDVRELKANLPASQKVPPAALKAEESGRFLGIGGNGGGLTPRSRKTSIARS